MQNRNATDKLNLFANFANEICGRITMLVCYIVDLAHFYFAFCILQVTTNLQSSVSCVMLNELVCK